MEFITKLKDLFESTHIQKQIVEVDYVGLAANPWFMVPFGLWVAYMLFKQRFKGLLIFIICAGVWYATGTDYMASLLVGGEISVDKILPVVFGGAVAMGLVIYILFGRSD